MRLARAKQVEQVESHGGVAVVAQEQERPVASKSTRLRAAHSQIVVQAAGTVFGREQIHTKAFKDWFGASKVLDAAGLPKVVYHGALRVFESFDTERSSGGSYYGSGAYFTSSREDLGNYTNLRSPDRRESYQHQVKQAQQALADQGVDGSYTLEQARKQVQKENAKGRTRGCVYPVYLRMTNPVRVAPTGGTVFKVDDAFRETLRTVAKASPSHARNDNGIDEWIDEVVDDLTMDTISAYDLEDHFKEKHSLLGMWKSEGDIFRRLFLALGHDGVMQDAGARFARMKGMEAGVIHYVVFDPRHIKSALGNCGAFDPHNPDLRA